MVNLKYPIVSLGLLLLLCNAYAQTAKNNRHQKDGPDSTRFEVEIKKLMHTPRVSKALSLIQVHDEQTITNQIRLSEIQSPPFKENMFGKTKVFAALLKEYGADSVWTDAVGNTLGLRKGTQRNATLAVAAHMDVVFPEGTDVKVRRSNDTLYGPGIADDNRGLAAILTILRTLNESGVRTKDDILFIGNVGEEGLGDLRGTKYLFREGAPKIDAFISVEPGEMERITNGGLGSHRYRVTFLGPGGHSWGSFGLANPIHALAQTIAIFTREADAFTKEGLKTSYNVGTISGGTSVNSIPFSATMEVDMRSLSQSRLNEIDTLLQQAVQAGLAEQNKMRRSGPALTVEVKMVGNRPSGETAPGQPLVQSALAATKIMGAIPELGTSSSDSNIPISKGIPAITMGAGGDSGKHHSLNEWFVNKDGYKAIQKVLLVILAEAGISN